MKTQPDNPITFIPKNLHQLVGLTTGNLMPSAVQRNSFIVNEVSRKFIILTNEKILSIVLNSLLSTVVSHTKHGCIRIKAKKHDDIICVSIRDNSSFSNYADTRSLEKVRLLAKKMNGSVSIRNIEDKFTTILLSFPNFTKAA